MITIKKIIVIVGPTGVGKTKLSIMLAKKYNGEIINADSMQIYKDLNIGTAKITKEEKEGIPHHLFDIKHVTEEYSIYNYQKDCRKAIKDIQSRNKTVILVGGTGLYIKSALYDYKLNEKTNNNNYDNIPTEELYNKLIKLDKDSIDKIDKNNRRRIINALSYYLANNKSITQNKTNKLLYDTYFIGLTTNRDELYKIINNRVDIMVKNGLIEEVKQFHNNNIYTKPLTGGIGYKELYNYFDNKISLDEAIDKIKKDSRNYAKRQYTFFNNSLPTKWFNTDYNNFTNTYNEIINYIENNNK
ncbi:MAG: tRNA (adenosine(37)-N6)-dimethylallyltransferase MiaA [Bacilli bacterium]|nr:tRNA (adenosine(37)-N6)-dimethylallyltransferase MiaA [Bacilli bacterium]